MKRKYVASHLQTNWRPSHYRAGRLPTKADSIANFRDYEGRGAGKPYHFFARVDFLELHMTWIMYELHLKANKTAEQWPLMLVCIGQISYPYFRCPRLHHCSNGSILIFIDISLLLFFKQGQAPGKVYSVLYLCKLLAGFDLWIFI